MIHHLSIGHFDVSALQHRKLLVLKPLDNSAITRVLNEFGLVRDGNTASLSGHPLRFMDGYIECPWLMPQRIIQAGEFAKRLCSET